MIISYDGTPAELDQITYDIYGSEYSSIGDFRRASINKMIKGVSDTINLVKPYVRFGVSPFGIYGNGMNPPGIIGLDAYNTIYSDPLAWLNQGSVDYLAPQLYWPTGGNQDFGTLLPWWAEKANSKNRQLFAGQGIYRLSDDPAVSLFNFNEILYQYSDILNPSLRELEILSVWTLEEIITQINIIRQNSNKSALGSLFFRASDFERVKNLKTYLHEYAYNYKSVLPVTKWKNSPEVAKVENIHIKLDIVSFGTKIAWNKNGDDRYAIYKIKQGTDVESQLIADNLIDIAFRNSYVFPAYEHYDSLSLAIVGYNRYWKSGEVSDVFTVMKPEVPVLISPDNLASVGDQVAIKWKLDERASNYILEISEYSDFEQISFVEEVLIPLFALKDCYLEGEKSYYWRVKSVNIVGESDYSEIRKFTILYPAEALILSPVNGEETYDRDPMFKFSFTENTEQLHVKLSTDSLLFQYFTFLDTIFPAIDSIKFPIWLDVNNEYYATVNPINEFGEGLESGITSFRVIETVDVDNLDNDVTFNLYPNPAHDVIFVKSDYFKEDRLMNFEIFDLMGRKLRENSGLRVYENTISIDMKDLKCNQCYLKITGDNFVKVMKFLRW